MNRTVKIFDTTLRDGEQSPGSSMNLKEKLEMARQLEQLGVDIIEAGFPMASPEDFEAVQAVARQIKTCQVAALCRATQADIDRAAQALRDAASPRLHMFIATSPIHMEYKLRMSPQEVLQRIESSVRYARGLCEDVQFCAEDASRSDREFLLKALQIAAQAGAGTLNITDTVGYAAPEEIFELVSYLREHLPQNVTLSIHCHNDLGCAVANTLAALRAGALQAECTVNGIGERAGNTSLEEVVMALHTRRETYHIDTNIRTRQLYRTSKLLSTITGVPVPRNKPIVGANAFAHESGIHQHGVMNNRSTYEILSPEEVGIYQNRMVLGKHSGRHALEERLFEMGYQISSRHLDEVFERFKLLADRKRTITDRDIEALVGSSATPIREAYRLKTFVVNSGSVISATAVVCLEMENGEDKEHVARGDGPIDAAFKAIDRIVKKGYSLENYSIQSVTEGEDALGEVVVRLKTGDGVITGRGLSTDIIEASIKAYVNAVNKAIIQQQEI